MHSLTVNSDKDKTVVSETLLHLWHSRDTNPEPPRDL